MCVCLLLLLQRDMFRCSAKCFDRPTDSTGQIRECVERCQRPVVKAEQTVTEELDAFQVRHRVYPDTDSVFQM